ncbi:division/outer membrane stress-associated lipid-binding lipoprotein [Thalassomonas sp. RHCl1]|uniref:division/outer membrane stress-associated lipid-binding lipoprotein n=1 Tax=Thalassomonas sp. RHCl1 TaxID=2995320 RepID=UPI00248BBC78|nr:division/outer membrane stress-associated lipid-binding lipoprotein [Thalassomonas sp. RHCl1]
MAFKRLALTVLAAALLQGCVAAAVVGVAGTAQVANDKRSIGNQIDDQVIELDAYASFKKQQGLTENTNLQVVSVNGSVLIVGQSPNTYLRDLAIKTLNNIEGVVKVHNQIRIGNVTSITTRTNDLWLTSKVKTALFADEKIKSGNIKVVTENAEVFLMGLVSQSQANMAVEIARNIGGVNRVLKAFEYQ